MRDAELVANGSFCEGDFIGVLNSKAEARLDSDKRDCGRFSQKIVRPLILVVARFAFPPGP